MTLSINSSCPDQQYSGMLVSSTRQIVIPMTLQDQLHDLTVKYETLENQYNTTKLECKEYRHQIAISQHQNDDLQKELDHYRDQQDHHEKHIKPMLNLHINSIQSSLEDNDEQMERLKETNKQNLQLLNEIKSENITIKEQNEKYRIALEKYQKQNHIFQQTHKDTIVCKNNEINSLQNELAQLRDQLHRIKTVKFSIATPSQIDSIQAQIPHLPEVTPRIPFITSEIEPHSPFQFANLFSYDIQNRSVRGTDEYTQQRLEKLELENAALIKKLNMLQINCDMDEKFEELNAGYKFIDASESDVTNDVMDEFDDDDIQEMEQLFIKCDTQNLLSPRKNITIINKNKFNWLLCYQIFK